MASKLPDFMLEDEPIECANCGWEGLRTHLEDNETCPSCQCPDYICDSDKNYDDEVGLRNEDQDENYRKQLFNDCYSIKNLPLHSEQIESLKKGAFCILLKEELLNKGEIFTLENNDTLKYSVKNVYEKKFQEITTSEMFKIMSVMKPKYNFNEYVNVVFGNKIYESNETVYIYYIEEFEQK